VRSLSFVSLSPRNFTRCSENVQFYIPGPKFQRLLLRKILGAKNMQNLARFRLTLNLTANVSRMDENVQNRSSTWSTAIPLVFGKKYLVNFGPLITEISVWNHTHLNRLFSKDHILASKGCWAAKFFHTLEIDQDWPSFASAPPLGVGVSLANFFKGGPKLA